ncbi:hypothetical protein EVAR_29754_1 [Eumeta japonica]|uniref:Uncharacterized protein n=1 Tax=Eumeta variegata TaxID=151549 RepID=A0A4C1WW97_EUMVA|nr:hypothetical protein EVAR_29754_1 [Eumeta japonica]
MHALMLKHPRSGISRSADGRHGEQVQGEAMREACCDEAMTYAAQRSSLTEYVEPLDPCGIIVFVTRVVNKRQSKSGQHGGLKSKPRLQ